MPEALDDTAYRTELTYMAAVWPFTCLSWRLEEALKSDEKSGRWSIRGRLLWYLQTVVRMSDEADVLPGVKRAAQAWLADLSGRWPGVTPLGLFPAFAPGRRNRPSDIGYGQGRGHRGPDSPAPPRPAVGGQPRHRAAGFLPTPAAAKPVGKAPGGYLFSARAQARMGWMALPVPAPWATIGRV